MDRVRLGIIGLGNMGSSHAAYMHALKDATLAAVCDIDATKLKKIGDRASVVRNFWLFTCPQNSSHKRSGIARLPTAVEPSRLRCEGVESSVLLPSNSAGLRSRSVECILEPLYQSTIQAWRLSPLCGCEDLFRVVAHLQ